ncbi:MAG: TonB-dependent receptor [Desulfobacterales bacterium]|nr:TonB-dependent receptor [Desulfobacterales bacterium]
MKKIIAVFALFFLFNNIPALSARAESGKENITKSEEENQAFEDMFGQGPQEEDVYSTDRLLLTATGSLKPVHLAPAVASVITAEDIEKLGATTLDEVLETVPGLHVTPSFVRLDSIYSIRGIHTRLNPQVLILMNGTPFNRMHTGTRPMGFRLPVSMISRIEVVRGPGSALYGADAFAGTINIITKDHFEVDGAHTGIRLGSFDGLDVWAQHGGLYKGWDIGIGLEYWRSGSDDNRIVDADLQTRLDKIFGTDASLAPGPLHTDFENYNLIANFTKKQWRVRFWGWFLNNYKGGTGVAGALGPESEINSNLLSADISWHDENLLDHSEFTVQMNYQFHKDDTMSQVLPPESTVPIGTNGIFFTSPTAGITTFTDGAFGQPILTEHRLLVDIIAKYKGWSQHVWRIGIGVGLQDENAEEYKNFGPGVLDGNRFSNSKDGTMVELTGTEHIFMFDQNRTVPYVSLQDEWAFSKNWELTAGVRYDHYSDFGKTINPRIALVWETRYDLTTKLMYGQAFRPPAVTESYVTNNPIVLGNPDLDPETINTFELALDYRPMHNLKAIASFFIYDIEGLIDYAPDPAPATSKTAQNLINQRGGGFELELGWEVMPSLTVSSNFTYQNSEDKDTGTVVADAPGMQLYLNTHWNFMPEWYLNAQYSWIGDRQRAEDDSREDIKDNTIMNMTIRRKNITQHIDLAFSVRNLLNEDIREPTSSDIPNDFPMESRSIYAEMTYHY